MHLMAEALGEGLSRQELHQRIVHASILCTGALSACIFERTAANTMRSVAVEGLFPPHRPLPDHVKGTLTTRAKFIEQVLRAEEVPVGDGIVGRVAETGRGELVADAAADPRIVRHDDPNLAGRSVIAVPMMVRDRFLGSSPSPTRWTAGFSPRPSAPSFSLWPSRPRSRCTMPSSSTSRLSAASSTWTCRSPAGSSRCSCASQSTVFAGLDLDARYEPAQRVGGDLFDIIVLSPTRLGVAVADVSGKGIAASLYMAVCRTNLRQIAPRHQSPAQTLIELNRTMGADIHGDLYVTLLYAVIDIAANSVVFARGGHELPLFARKDPSTGNYLAHLVRSEGMPLGLVPDDIFISAIEDKTESFKSGDTLVLYTDGVTETPNDDEKEFSSARLADVVRALHSRSAKEINDGILESVRRFSGDVVQRDDLTLVTVRRS